MEFLGGSIRVLGKLPMYANSPHGFHEISDLADSFGDLYTGDYTTPSYTSKDHFKAAARYDVVCTPLDKSTLAKAGDWVKMIWNPYLLGVDFANHRQVMDNMDMTTSVGYAYSTYGSCKREVLAQFGDQFLDQAFNLFRETPYQGYWKNFLKDELRKVGKDTRGILCAPLDIFYIMSRFFLLQNKAFYATYLLTPSAVGISRDGLMWHAVYRRLARFLFGASIDYKQFDSKMQAALMEMVCLIRKSFFPRYRKDELHLIDECYEQLINTIFIVCGFVVQKSGGNPSGSVNTTVDNTLVGALIFIYAYISLNPGKTLDDFLDEVSTVIYGDDNAYTWDEEKCEMAPTALAKTLGAAFGYVITTDGKVSVEALTFLSAGFAKATWGVRVPVFDQNKMICHIVQSPHRERAKQFLRVAGIRAVACWDDTIVSKADEWLNNHRSYVSPDVYKQVVLPLEVLRAMYFAVKREPLAVVQNKTVLNLQSRFKEMDDLRSTVRNTSGFTGAWGRGIDNALSAAGLTQDGKDYVAEVCDPFYDTPRRKVGIPDEYTGKEVIFEYNGALQLSCPASIAGTWDLLIFWTGNVRPSNQTYDDQGGAGTTTMLAQAANFSYDPVTHGPLALITASAGGTGNYWQCGPWLIYAVPTGQPFFPTETGWVDETHRDRFFLPPDLDQYFNGSTRVICGGIEVIDTSASLYQQGMLTVGSIPCTNQEIASYPVFNGNYDGIRASVPLAVFSAPPGSLADAKQMPLSQSWAMKEGAYVPLRPAKMKNDYVQAWPRIPVWANRLPSYANGITNTVVPVVLTGFTPVAYTQTYPSGTPNTQFTPVMPMVQAAPFHHQFVVCTGLGVNSTITVNFRLRIAQQPDLSDPLLVTLAENSPVHDEAALEMVAKLFDTLPLGCPVAMNANGGWWQKVLGGVKKYAPVIGKALSNVGVPGAEILGEGASKLAGWLEEDDKPKKMKGKGMQTPTTNGNPKNSRALPKNPPKPHPTAKGHKKKAPHPQRYGNAST